MISSIRRIALFAVALAFLLISHGKASACSCAFDKPSAEIKESDAVFIGTIVEELVSKEKWKVKVSSVIKGEVNENVFLFASMKGTSCEIANYKVGETLVFFMNQLTEAELRDEDSAEIHQKNKERIGNYESRVCSWTTLLSDWETEWYRKQLKEFKDEGFLKTLKKGKKPNKSV